MRGVFRIPSLQPRGGLTCPPFSVSSFSSSPGPPPATPPFRRSSSPIRPTGSCRPWSPRRWPTIRTHARARADVLAERARVPQAGALADPTLVLGIQNDGFQGIKIGVEPTSFWQVLLNVPLSWPGKRGLREDVAEAQLGVAEAALQRVRLSLLGEVERAYLDLRLVRGQLVLQERLESLWKQAEEIARARYQVGEAPQSDLLRAQLERTRLRLQRLALESAERTGAAGDQPPARPPPRRAGRHPARPRRCPPRSRCPRPEALLADAEARSPDLALAARNVGRREARVKSAYRERWPDLSLTAAIMPRGQLEPMWAASVGLIAPHLLVGQGVARGRRGRAVRTSEQQGVESVRQLLVLRTRERHTALPRCSSRSRSTGTASWSSPTPRCAPPSSSTGWARSRSPRCWR